MAKTYVFRMDDISWDMNYENFSRIRDLFFKYDIRPLIGIIPKNEDPKLKAQVGERHLTEEEFWSEMRSLQRDRGWAIALHGYDHVYITEDSGIFGINKRAEFADVPYEVQEEKIRLGKEILEANGLTIDAFMAPAHSLDWNTVEALKKNGIFVVTDGLTAYPYHKNGMLFIPQVWSWPHKISHGIATACFHVNTWDNQRFIRFEKFLQQNFTACTSFQEIVSLFSTKKSLYCEIVNMCITQIIPLEKALISFIKRHL